VERDQGGTWIVPQQPVCEWGLSALIDSLFSAKASSVSIRPPSGNDPDNRAGHATPTQRLSLSLFYPHAPLSTLIGPKSVPVQTRFSSPPNSNSRYSHAPNPHIHHKVLALPGSNFADAGILGTIPESDSRNSWLWRLECPRPNRKALSRICASFAAVGGQTGSGAYRPLIGLDAQAVAWPTKPVRTQGSNPVARV
jgi:hypothetical protein